MFGPNRTKMHITGRRKCSEVLLSDKHPLTVDKTLLKLGSNGKWHHLANIHKPWLACRAFHCLF